MADADPPKLSKHVTARWSRKDKPIAIAAAVVATLRYEPHDHSNSDLRELLEEFIGVPRHG